MTQNYLVTGSAGFIGSKVTEFLLNQGHAVTGVDNMNDAYDVRLKEWRLRRLLEKPKFTFAQSDISDKVAVRMVFASGPEYQAVINLAARAGVRQSVENPWVYVDTNITGTLNLLELCKDFGVPKFVLASTSSLYGSNNPQPFTESANTDSPLSPYAASKKAAEAFAYNYHFLYNIDVTVLRYFTVYGPAGRPDMSLFRFVKWIGEGVPVLVNGDGRQTRDFTYVDDIARGTIAGLKPVGYEIVNLGSDTPTTLTETIKIIEHLLEKKAKIVHGPIHPADVPSTWANISKAEKLFGWRPQVSIEQGLIHLVQWYRENQSWASQLST
ncbi:MAG: GDP-mannose 4,6-dehydratase [Chloroflexi bacterium]|nr:GDP-mannose 4,6-dehydratase [Chloroflexota bacterium]